MGAYFSRVTPSPYYSQLCYPKSTPLFHLLLTAFRGPRSSSRPSETPPVALITSGKAPAKAPRRTNAPRHSTFLIAATCSSAAAAARYSPDRDSLQLSPGLRKLFRLGSRDFGHRREPSCTSKRPRATSKGRSSVECVWHSRAKHFSSFFDLDPSASASASTSSSSSTSTSTPTSLHVNVTSRCPTSSASLPCLSCW